MQYGIKAKDGMIEAGIGTPKLPTLKGRFCIELFDAETGEKQDEYVKDNMVTDAVAQAFASNYGGKLNYDMLKPIMDVFFGGIFCFQNALTESASNIYPPSSHDNPVIAHAGQTTYSSADADTTRGLPNDVESGVITGGYKRVWDFPATQGNGTIAALGFVHSSIGDCWNSSLDSNTNIAVDGGSNSQDSSGEGSRMPTLFDDANDIAYAFYKTSTGIKIRKFDSYGIISGVGLLQSTINVNVADANYTDYEYTISNSGRARVMLYNGDIHILIPNASTISRYIIDTSDMSMSSDTITPNLGSGSFLTSDVTFGGSGSNPAIIELSDTGEIAFVGTNNKIYVFDYTSAVNIREVAASSSTEYAIMDTLCFGKWFVFPIAGSFNTALLTDGYICYTVALNSTSGSDWGYHGGYYRAHHTVNSAIRLKSANAFRAISSRMPQCELFKLFMATVKNLESPVTKTATQTMKITYSITEVEES